MKKRKVVLIFIVIVVAVSLFYVGKRSWFKKTVAPSPLKENVAAIFFKLQIMNSKLEGMDKKLDVALSTPTSSTVSVVKAGGAASLRQPKKFTAKKEKKSPVPRPKKFYISAPSGYTVRDIKKLVVKGKEFREEIKGKEKKLIPLKAGLNTIRYQMYLNDGKMISDKIEIDAQESYITFEIGGGTE